MHSLLIHLDLGEQITLLAAALYNCFIVILSLFLLGQQRHDLLIYVKTETNHYGILFEHGLELINIIL